ncbi:Metal-dependent_phosphoesterase [Hexamita inflata]|uniref:Metal-dependent phosphoesterase n=1 Tax=Hexamita inflata TaxID=28002 RepID=A0AA86TU75_9EUKA|nr:Metal-dependent phosphoesterase [Hexamita inflata]
MSVLMRRENTLIIEPGSDISKIQIINFILLPNSKKHFEGPPLQQAFDKYLNYEMATSKPLILEAMIKLAVNMRAVPILAHPLQSTKISSDLSNCFGIWQKLGLKIIEIEHPTMSVNDKEYLKVIAKQNNFYQSIASDFHSDERSQNWQSDFGNSEGNLRVSNLEKMKTLDYIFSSK